MLKNAYTFETLPAEDSIRLLRLLPNEPSADLECELFSVRLSDKPVYRAISYVWGSRNPEATIRCGGDTIIITKNCKYALQRIRNRAQALTLWVDSICINQKDFAERAQQVRNMGNIYRQAACVLICLGPCQEGDSKAILADISILVDMIRRPLSQGMTLRQIIDLPLQPEVKDRLSAHDFRPWRRFWEVPYWNRTWVVQEVGLASKAVLMYGPDEIQWQDLMYACTWLEYTAHLPSIPSGSAVRCAWASYDRHNRTQFSTRGNCLPSEIAFFDCLDSTRRGREATDPRDMIYAFLEHPDGHKFLPDYFQSVEVVYYNFAISCLDAYKDPTVLSYATRSAECKPLEGLPTWCPMWNDKGFIPSSLTGMNRSMNFKPSGMTPFEYAITGHKLTVSGIFFGTIKFATTPIYNHHIYHDDENSDSNYNPLLDAFQASWSSLNGCAAVYSDLVTSFAKVLTAGRPIGTDVTASLRQKGSRVDANSISQWYRELVRETVGDVFFACRNRSFFITQQGHMGIGPPNTQQEDICCIFLGAKMPFILRSIENGAYNLIGESYIEGIMDGKIIKMLENKELEKRLITLI